MASVVFERASARDGAEFEVTELGGYRLPRLDEAEAPIFGRHQNAHTKTWTQKIAPVGVLQNALGYSFAKWHDKAVGFVSYGTAGGTRATAQLRVIASEL